MRSTKEAVSWKSNLGRPRISRKGAENSPFWTGKIHLKREEEAPLWFQRGGVVKATAGAELDRSCDPVTGFVT